MRIPASLRFLQHREVGELACLSRTFRFDCGILLCMSDVTQILNQIRQGDSNAAAQLLPLVYDELRKLASLRMSNERADHSLQPTALVHEAYLRLVVSTKQQDDRSKDWDSRGHFFAAAAEAMRRILVESARRRDSVKRGGRFQQVDLDKVDQPYMANLDNVVVIDEALTKLADDDAKCAELVKLRYFAGLPLNEAAEIMGISRATGFRYWAYAKAFLACELEDDVEKK